MTDWTDSQMATLRRLWREGHTASQIKLALGNAFTRSAILSKVHRMKLDGRPSPIKADAEEVAHNRKLAWQARRGGVRLRPRKPAAETRVQREARLAPVQAAERPGAAINVKLVTKPAPRPVAKSNPFRTCQWLEGEARLRAFCGAKTVPGHSWCEAHCLRVYQPRDVAAEKAEAA